MLTRELLALLMLDVHSSLVIVFWFLSFISRDCNFAAHELAQWAKHSDYCGEIALDSLPDEYRYFDWIGT